MEEKWFELYRELDRFYAHRTEIVDGICRELGLSEDFFDLILEESDSSFILRLHAILESYLSLILSESCFRLIGPSEKGKIIELCGNMNFDGRVSKISLIRIFNILPASELINYCLSLNKLRNIYSHRIEKINSTIAEITSEDANLRSRLVLEGTPDAAVSRRNIDAHSVLQSFLLLMEFLHKYRVRNSIL